MTPVSVLIYDLNVVLESARQLPHHDVSVCCKTRTQSYDNLEIQLFVHNKTKVVRPVCYVSVCVRPSRSVLHFELLRFLFLLFLLFFLLLIPVTFHRARSSRPLSTTLASIYIVFLVYIIFLWDLANLNSAMFLMNRKIDHPHTALSTKSSAVRLLLLVCCYEPEVQNVEY